MPAKARPATIGQLKRSRYKVVPVREEMRRNLVRILKAGARTHRGIFSINELPDLAERIQVGMFNLMEERDVQIKGYRIRLPWTCM